MGFIRKHDQPKGSITDINEYRGRKASAARDAAHSESPDYKVKDIHPLEAHYQSQVDLPKLGIKRPGTVGRFTSYAMRTMDHIGKKMGVIGQDESLYQDEPLRNQNDDYNKYQLPKDYKQTRYPKKVKKTDTGGSGKKPPKKPRTQKDGFPDGYPEDRNKNKYPKRPNKDDDWYA